jgi:hypothetical protein
VLGLGGIAGTATLFPEYLIYNLATDSDEKFQDIKNASAPYNGVGVLEVRDSSFGHAHALVMTRAPKSNTGSVVPHKSKA